MRAGAAGARAGHSPPCVESFYRDPTSRSNFVTTETPGLPQNKPATSDGRAGLPVMRVSAVLLLVGCPGPGEPAGDAGAVEPARVFDVGALPGDLRSGDVVRSGRAAARVPA